MLSKRSNQLNLDERYWQYHALKSLIDEDSEYFEQGLNACLPGTDELNAEGVAFLRQQDTKFANSMVNAGAVSQADLDAAHFMSQMFRHLETEWVDINQACRRLGLRKACPRVPGMPLNQTLLPWQVCALDGILQLRTKLRGMLLADVMEIGKTPVFISHILWVSSPLMPSGISYPIQDRISQTTCYPVIKPQTTNS